MNCKQLGNSGLIVSELCLGTITFGQGEYRGLQSTFDEKKADELVGNAIENGINFFDTADGYGNGQSEIILGKILSNNAKMYWLLQNYLSEQVNKLLMQV